MSEEDVRKINNMDFDMRGKVRCNLCLSCANSCKDVCKVLNIVGECEHYKKRLSLNEINKEIRRQNINIKRLCKENSLKYGKMKDMLKGKLHLKFKYYKTLEERIFEKREFVEYESRFCDNTYGFGGDEIYE